MEDELTWVDLTNHTVGVRPQRRVRTELFLSGRDQVLQAPSATIYALCICLANAGDWLPEKIGMKQVATSLSGIWRPSSTPTRSSHRPVLSTRLHSTASAKHARAVLHEQHRHTSKLRHILSIAVVPHINATYSDAQMLQRQLYAVLWCLHQQVLCIRATFSCRLEHEHSLCVYRTLHGNMASPIEVETSTPSSVHGRGKLTRQARCRCSRSTDLYTVVHEKLLALYSVHVG